MGIFDTLVAERINEIRNSSVHMPETTETEKKEADASVKKLVSGFRSFVFR